MPILVGVLLTVIVAGIGAVLFLNRPPTGTDSTPTPGATILVTDTPTPARTETGSNPGGGAIVPDHTPTATPTQSATNTPVPPADTPTATNTTTSTPVSPTDTPTATNTATNTPVPPTHTPTATNTARPTGPTNTPTPLVMVTPTSTATSGGGKVSPTSTRVPTKTPTPTRVVPTLPPAPPASPAPAGQIDGFESTQGWSSSYAAWGSLSASSEKVIQRKQRCQTGIQHTGRRHSKQEPGLCGFQPTYPSRVHPPNLPSGSMGMAPTIISIYGRTQKREEIPVRLREDRRG